MGLLSPRFSALKWIWWDVCESGCKALYLPYIAVIDKPSRNNYKTILSCSEITVNFCLKPRPSGLQQFCPLLWHFLCGCPGLNFRFLATEVLQPNLDENKCVKPMWFLLFSVSVYFLRKQTISKWLGNLKFNTSVNRPLALALDLKWGPKNWE